MVNGWEERLGEMLHTEQREWESGRGEGRGGEGRGGEGRKDRKKRSMYKGIVGLLMTMYAGYTTRICLPSAKFANIHC